MSTSPRRLLSSTSDHAADPPAEVRGGRVDTLRRDLVAAAEAGGDDLKQAAERLAYALDPSARLALMEAISHAAAEITAELPQGSVDVRLVGRELDFVVEMAPPTAMPALPPPGRASTPGSSTSCAARPPTTRSTSTST